LRLTRAVGRTCGIILLAIWRGQGCGRQNVAFGSGHFNLAQGIVGTATGIGASLSTVLAGYVSDKFGSSMAFAGLAAAATVGLAMIWFVMPETRRSAG
jgi:predicted MFS family arabinose efflux permease